MGQRRTANILVTVEPDLYHIISKAADKDNLSRSGFFRKLAIDKLMKDGLLTNDMLLQITEG